MNNKKSQLHMMETISVLMIFFVIVIISVVVYFRMSKSQLEDNVEQMNELRRVQIVQTAASLPELQCSEDNILKSNCIDMLKLTGAAPLMKANQDKYFDLLGYSNVTIRKIFPAPAEEWVLYSKTNNNSAAKIPTYFPISLYNPIDSNNEFGVIIVEVFQ
jgi:hypothetical protein